MQATGTGGELRVGSRRAAVLGRWELRAASGMPAVRFDITAAVAASDSYWITQGPFTVDLQFGRWHWRWDGVRAVVEAGTASMLVCGRPEMVRDAQV